jgi:plastocyanin
LTLKTERAFDACVPCRYDDRATSEADPTSSKGPIPVTIRTPALRRGALLSVSLGLVAVLAGHGAASSDDNTAGGTVSVVDGAVAISADALAFDANVIQATAGEAFTVTFTNNEAAVHNFSVYTEEGGDEVVIGDVIGEGETNEVEVPALEPGEYFFVCDVHSTEMTGVIVVEG